jgi:hypothetical protein
MADNSSSKVLLSKWLLDTSSWANVVKEAKAQLASLAEATKTQATQDKAASESSISYLKQEQALQSAVTAEAKAQTAAIQKAAAEQRAKAESAKAANAQALATSIAQKAMSSAMTEASRAEAAAKRTAAEAASSGLKSEILQRTANIKKIQEENAALRLQKAASSGVGRAQGEGQAQGGILSRFLGAGAQGALGGGLLGGLAMGAIGGGAAVAGITFLTEGFEKLIEKIKEFIEDSGNLQKVLDTFQKLSTGIGQNPTQFLDKLRESTHNLVNDTNLLRAANAFMQSGLKISVEDVLKLTQAVVGLARANGKDATQAVDALNRSFLTGRAQMLAYVTGIQRAQLQFRGMTSEMSQTQRQQAQFSQTLQVIEKRYAQIGEPVLTFTDRLTQLRVVYNQITEAFSQSVVTSGGFTVLIDQLGKLVTRFGGLESIASRFGSAVGNIAGLVAASIDAIIPVAKDLFTVFVDLFKTSTSLFKGFLEGASSTDGVKNKFSEMHPVLDGMIRAIYEMSAAVQILLLRLDDLIKKIPTLEGVGRSFANNPIWGLDKWEWNKIKGIAGLGQGSPTPGSLPKAALSTDTGNLESEAGAVPKEQASAWQSDVKTEINRIQDNLRKHEIEIRNLHGKTTDQINDRIKAARLDAQAEILTAKQEFAAHYGLSYKPTAADIMVGTDINIRNAEEQFSTLGTPGSAKVSGDIPDQALARRNALALARANMESKQRDAQEALAKQKELIQDETDANEAMYKKGEEEARQYYDAKIKLAYASFHATENSIEAEAQARKDELTSQLKEGSLQGGTAVYKIKIADINKDTDTKIENARKELRKQTDDAILASDDAVTQGQIVNLQTELAAEKSAAADRTAVIQKEFQEGSISANEYLKDRINVIQQITDREIDSQTQISKLQEKNPKAAAETIKAMVASVSDAKKQIDQLAVESLTTVFQDTSKRYNSALAVNSSMQTIAEGGGASALGANKYALQQQQVQILNSQVQAMQQLLAQAEPYSNTWLTIYENILKATEQAQQLTQEIQKEQAGSTIIGGVLGSIAQQAQGIFKGSFSSGFVRSLAGGASALQQAPDLQQHLNAIQSNLQAGKAGPAQSPLQQAQAAFATGVQQMSQQATSAATGLQQFVSTVQQVLQQLTDAITNFTNSISGKSGADNVLSTASQSSGLETQQQNLTEMIGGGGKSSSGGGGSGGNANIFSTLKSAISGIVSGNSGSFAQLGQVLQVGAQALGNFVNVISNANSPLGGAFGGAQAGASLGSMAGPWGELAGAIGGGLMGFIAGGKQQQIHQDLVDMQATYRQMMEAFSAGTQGLNQTITQLQSMVAQLTAEQASSKKGGSQYQDLINQYNQQLDQLQAQATQTLQQLQQQVAMIAQPDAYQQWVQNIDSVIQQYAQFAGAASTVQELAQANQFLVSSLQNIGQQIGDQLLSEEESAVQNALQLNDLYNQRNQLEYQYLQQVESIMSSGNVTRQMTQAQTKFSQLFNLQANYTVQLDELNQQIAVSQYQLTVQQQIFSLATTRLGLEQQMTDLQEQGIREDVQRIEAMQNLLATLQATGYSITNLGALSASDPNALANQLLQDLVNELNTGQNTMSQQLQELINILSEYGGLPGASATNPATPSTASTSVPNPNSLTGIFSAAYQSRAAFAYGAFRGAQF